MGIDILEVFGPVSVRHPDAYTLNQSHIEEKLEQCQAGQQRKFKMYGDSAYFNDEYLVTGGPTAFRSRNN